ncbi:flippase activity-associated protein Agl23 [Halobium salinum]|uniref:Flippase activity-associated protein Agl23 n=1 Tax=Halobium salinum TaxID=1364940 RepID=A0ABD5PD92_9EURY|nr:flippase activity-associated protein Agl23 [Halobium salinum]
MSSLSVRRLREREEGGVLPLLVAVSVVALLARLYALGWRVFHQDEGRVGDWILHYMEFGEWQYRAIIHGPFLPHVNGVVFSLFGASDFTARLVVALFGALLPLSAWLFRERLSRTETVTLALVLAADPALLYYSRFMRNDVPLATVMFVALGLFVRALDTRRPRYLYPAAFVMGLGFAMKENAFLYPVCWLGALVLILDRETLLASHRDGRDPLDAVADRLAAVGRGLAGWMGHVVAALALFLLVVFLFYAPKPELYGVLADPLAVGGVADSTITRVWNELQRNWLSGHLRDHSYLEFFGWFAKTMAFLAAPLAAAAVVGFLVDRYDPEGPRNLVALCFFWGVASFFGYPLAVDINAAWNLAHVNTPLAVPAAVGFAAVYRSGRLALARDDGVAVGAAAALLLVSAGFTGFVAVDNVYVNPQGPDSRMVQYAQPAGEMQGQLREIERIAADNEGTDVMFYGGYNDGNDRYYLYSPDENWSRGEQPTPGWFSRLPLPWYFSRYDADVNSTNSAETFAERRPPVVVALDSNGFGNNATDLRPYLAEDYVCREYQGYQHGRPLAFFVREDVAGDAPEATPCFAE